MLLNFFTEGVAGKHFWKRASTSTDLKGYKFMIFWLFCLANLCLSAPQKMCSCSIFLGTYIRTVQCSTGRASSWKRKLEYFFLTLYNCSLVSGGCHSSHQLVESSKQALIASPTPSNSWSAYTSLVVELCFLNYTQITEQEAW